MRIGLIAVDSDHPNLALMKISGWHKSRGDEVEWFSPLFSYDEYRLKANPPVHGWEEF